MTTNKDLHSFDEILDEQFGASGTPEREQFRNEAYNYCAGTIIREARRREKMTQQQLAEKVGTTKSYISRIEKGVIEPGIALFFRIINALGMRIEFVTADGMASV